VEDQNISDFFDEENGVVYISIDRVTIAIDVEDFESFFEGILDIRKSLLSNESIALGAYEEDGIVKHQFIMKKSQDFS
jgi:hypothetical protein